MTDDVNVFLCVEKAVDLWVVFSPIIKHELRQLD